MARIITILDTTLRDGEQVPGAKLNLTQKLTIAKQLRALNVDYIEAGFPSSSKGDFDAVAAIASEMKAGGPWVTALARAVKGDIDAVYESVKSAARPMIHIVLGASDVHVQKKFNKSREEVLAIGVEAVRYAKTLLPDVQYSTEDATRSDFDYLMRTIEAVIRAGATIVNVPDTVGFGVPEEFGALIYKINDRMKNLNPNVLLSVHCHNDLGMATANTLAAIKNGADKVECTINGLGERAGNCALEEVVMGLVKRPDYYGASSRIVTTEILKTSQLVSGMTGIDVQVNKAIVGDNAFAHSSGIHQDGLLKDKNVYEIIDPTEVGFSGMELVLTARSGKHALRQAVSQMGFDVSDEAAFEALHRAFLQMADSQKEVGDADVYALAKGILPFSGGAAIELYELVDFQVISNQSMPSATVRLRRGEEEFTYSSSGNGPVDALFNAIQATWGKEVTLESYKVGSISNGQDASGKSSLQLLYQDKLYSARAVDTDIIKASGLAFLSAINKILIDEASRG